MTEDLDVGLVGYGVAGRVFHAPLIESTPGLSLAGVVTNDPARRAALRAGRPGVPVLDTLDDLLRTAPGVVVIASPNTTHVPFALACVEAGVPVVVDKPFAPSAAQARQVLEAAEKASVPVTVFQNRRWDGDYLTFRRLLDEDALGTVHRFESRWEFTAAVDPARPGGGLLSELGVHMIDQAVQAFGPVARVYAELATRRPGGRVDDDVFVAVTHRSGTTSHLWTSAVAHDAGPRFRVLGDKASFTIHGLDVQENALAAGVAPGTPEWGVAPEESWGRLSGPDGVTRVPTEPGAYEVFYRRLASALREGGALPVDPYSTIETLDVIDAAARSARSGEVVPLS
ncbi:Gfo/Idh/MocA family oxidoreductase [Sphaerisporangium sp. NPDC005288]|uniref:Gfo/Idh/MocA family oxidoreductase n=1 Tax=Sphaerisporangium sp. NPDC005288 TaxID=3155114 RepID=UPI0033B03A31